MSGVVRTLSRCLLPAEAGARERRAGAARDAEREARRRSRDIDALLARERRAVRRLVKILLLGAGESGKSTFLKQMRIIHGREFDQKALLEFRDTIFDNILKVTSGTAHTHLAPVGRGTRPLCPPPTGDPAAGRPSLPKGTSSRASRGYSGDPQGPDGFPEPWMLGDRGSGSRTTTLGDLGSAGLLGLDTWSEGRPLSLSLQQAKFSV